MCVCVCVLKWCVYLLPPVPQLLLSAPAGAHRGSPLVQPQFSGSCSNLRWEELGTPSARSRSEARMHARATSCVCAESVSAVDGITTYEQRSSRTQGLKRGASRRTVGTTLPSPASPPHPAAQLAPIKRGNMLIRAETGSAPSPIQSKRGSLLKLRTRRREVAVLLAVLPAVLPRPSRRQPAMSASPVRGALLLCAFLQLCSPLGGQVPNCQEVRTAFHSVHPGSKLVPESPVSGKTFPL